MDSDQQDQLGDVGDVVQQATVQALKEFDSGEMAEDGQGTDGAPVEGEEFPAENADEEHPDIDEAGVGMSPPLQEEEELPELAGTPEPAVQPTFSPVNVVREPSTDHEGPSHQPLLIAPGGGGDGGGPPYGGGVGNDDELQVPDDYGQQEEGDLAPYEPPSDDSDEEADLVVLDPDHPLMERAQRALNKFLVKRLEKVTLEHRELNAGLKQRREEREELGVQLYGVQQELAKFQMNLEKCHDDFSQTHQERLHREQELSEIREMYAKDSSERAAERRRNAELMSENENLALRLFYMKNAKEDVRSDISVMRRAAEKADTELSKMELEKQRQDLYVDRLVERQDKLKEEIAMFEAQLTAQGAETKAAKEALAEAHLEIEAINLEKKQLFQQWNSSLIGMRRRDEAFAAMQQANDDLHQKTLSLDTEIEGYKKSIMKEQEHNEKLTLILQKTEYDIANVRKLFATCQAKHETLKQQYSTYTRMLHETEQALARTTADKQQLMAELNALRKQIESEFRQRVSLEGQIVERMREQLTMDKAAEYSEKITGKLMRRTRELEKDIAVVENQIAHDTMEVTSAKARISRLSRTFKELDDEISSKNSIISRCQTEQTRNNALVERKQGVIDQYNKKLEQMISAAGGVELGPLEIQINSLNKSHDLLEQELKEQQQIWLRNQSELVALTKEREAQTSTVHMLKKKFTILSQKKIRGERNIEGEMKETSDIERDIRHLRNDVIKLNTMLHREKGQQERLEASNALQESDFIKQLKEAEKSSIESQARLEGMKEEKERLLNSVIEAERQIMLWEKKTQLARETRAAVDSEVGQGEIKAMKAEIHRMEVRYTQLMKQQEKMIQEMEKSISRRDTIVTRGDAQAKMNKKVLTKGTFQRQMTETKKKIKTMMGDAQDCDREIGELQGHVSELGQQVDERQMNCSQLQGSADQLDGDTERLMEEKHRNLVDLLSLQQRTKWLQQLKDGRYTRLVKTDSALQPELQKQQERMLAIQAIVERVQSEYPHVQPALRKVQAELSAKTDALHGE